MLSLLQLLALLQKLTPFFVSQTTVLSNAVHPGVNIATSLLLLLYSGQHDYDYHRYNDCCDCCRCCYCYRLFEHIYGLG